MRNYQSSIARIENKFIFNAQYQLTAREQKVLLFLISNINPNDKKFGKQIIPIKQIKEVIMKSRSGSFYDEMIGFAETISNKQIKFQTQVKMGRRKLPGFINWFQSIVPTYNDGGDICLEFQFSDYLKPFLLELKEYTQIDYEEALPLGSGFSVRMYQVFRAHRDKMSKHQKKSKLKYELDELKTMLSIADKYKDWRKLNERVVQVIVKEINEHTNIKVAVNPIRKGRKVIALEFELWDKANRSKKKKVTVIGKLQFDSLTFAQRKAYTKLIGYSIAEDIALEMISRVGGSEFIGFEDWYFDQVISIFESKTTQDKVEAKAGTLVNWFLKKKIFEQGDHFARIIEAIQERKKKLQKERPDAFDNRLKAKGMSSEEFTNQFG